MVENGGIPEETWASENGLVGNNSRIRQVDLRKVLDPLAEGPVKSDIRPRVTTVKSTALNRLHNSRQTNCTKYKLSLGKWGNTPAKEALL